MNVTENRFIYKRRSLIFLILINISFILYGQVVPPDVINMQNNGARFAPVIEVVGPCVIEWEFDDGTTSSSTAPIKIYGTLGLHNNHLKVTPWNALIGINVGYDAGDEGYGGFQHGKLSK